MFASGPHAAASRPAITASSSFTGTRWARTGPCLKKDPASQAEAAAADAFPCRSAAYPRRSAQSDTPRLFQPDLRLRPADQRGRCSSRHRHRQDQWRPARRRQEPALAKAGGNKERVVPVPKEVHEGLRRMWQAQDHRDRRWLLPNSWRTGPVATRVLTRTLPRPSRRPISPAAAARRHTRCVTPMRPGSSRTRSTPASSQIGWIAERISTTDANMR